MRLGDNMLLRMYSILKSTFNMRLTLWRRSMLPILQPRTSLKSLKYVPSGVAECNQDHSVMRGLNMSLIHIHHAEDLRYASSGHAWGRDTTGSRADLWIGYVTWTLQGLHFFSFQIKRCVTKECHASRNTCAVRFWRVLVSWYQPRNSMNR